MNITLKDIVRASVEYLKTQGKSEFTTVEICDIALKIDQTRKRPSILGTLPGLVVGHRHPVYTNADQFLAKVRHGVYAIHHSLEKKTSDRWRKKPKKNLKLTRLPARLPSRKIS